MCSSLLKKIDKTTFVFLLLTSFLGFSQERYAKVLLKDKYTTDQARLISQHFKLNIEVRISRMDNSTNEFLCIFKESSEFSIQDILNWFDSQSIFIACYFEDVYVEGNMMDFKNLDCN